MFELINRLIENQVYLSYLDNKLTLNYDEGVHSNDELANILKEIKANKQDLIEYFQKHNGENSFKGIPKAAESDGYVLSSSQKRIWLVSQFEAANVAYNMPEFREFQGLDIVSFNRAIEALVARHEILRTVFREDDNGQLRQFIQPVEKNFFSMVYLDLKGRNAEVIDIVQNEMLKPFNLLNDPLFRVTLIQTSKDIHLALFVMHHIVSDGWSIQLLIRELKTLYSAFLNNQENPLPPLRIQYKDYAHWEQMQFDSEEYAVHKEYWLNQFAGEIQALNVLDSNKRPKIKTYNGARKTWLINLESLDAFKTILVSHDATLFMGTIALINTLLFRYSGEKDIIIGSPIAGRTHPDLEDQLGCFINTLALRTNIHESNNFLALLENVKTVTINAFEHQIYPFDQMVEDLDLKRDFSRNPLFDVMVVLQNAVLKDSSYESQKEESNLFQNAGYEEKVQCKFDLKFDFLEQSDGLLISIEYNTDLFQNETIERMFGHLEQLVQSISSNPEKTLNELDLLKTDEKAVLAGFNATHKEYPLHLSLIDLIEEQVVSTPNNQALSFRENSLTYVELNEIVNQLSGYLSSCKDIVHGDFVGVELERSEWMVIAILAILKLGAAYVPIDIEFPQKRIEYIREDCKCSIDQKMIDQFLSVKDQFSPENRNTNLSSDDLAYIIYTSGSTGSPKGVLLAHKGVVNRMLWMKESLEVNEFDTFLQKTPITFDVSVWELFLPLITGSRLVIAEPLGHKDPHYLNEVLVNERISIIHFVPSMLDNAMPSINWKDLNGLRHVVCSGEALTRKMVKQFFDLAGSTRIHNYYGPTEASVDVTSIELKEDMLLSDVITIGKPVENTAIYILNKADQIQPIGAIGEIVIGGVQVGKGYLNNESLTNEKFIQNPFNPDEKVYRTGDFGKWLSNGEIEFLGRMDNQFKIRGNRIELGEITNAIESIDEVDKAVVVVMEVYQNEKEIVAYVVASKPMNATNLRAELGQILPNYMIPSFFVQLDQIPLTPNGKVDSRKLPALEGKELSVADSYIAPSSELEVQLTKLISQLLPTKGRDIGVNDNFFDIGVNSLSLVKFTSLINTEMKQNLKVLKLFEYPTIALLAQLLTPGEKLEDDLVVNDNEMDEMIDLMNDFE